VAETAKCLAELHELSPDDIATATTGNFHRLFGVPHFSGDENQAA
jgi:Tat protein secretion system quality control protein TatD with DNase activity